MLRAAAALSFPQAPAAGARRSTPPLPPPLTRWCGHDRRVSVSVRVLNNRNSDAVIGGSGAGNIRQPNSNYVVPFDTKAASPSCITRPLVEILRDLNKRVPDGVVKGEDKGSIPWYHANRLLSFYAPGWCGEVRNVILSDDGNVTVTYRVTVRGSDGEAHRDSTGTVNAEEGRIEDAVAAAEELAFCRACARFGLGLYLYHEDEAI